MRNILPPFSINMFFLIIIGIVLIGVIVYWIFQSPFQYPYKKIFFDISGKRKPNENDLLDHYLIQHGIQEFVDHASYVELWKKECEQKVQKSKLKNLRSKQYLECIDDEGMFLFILERKQTRYRQVNYVKHHYHVKIPVRTLATDLCHIQIRYDALKKIGFECTLSEYYAKDQRKRMTKELREKIAKRDNYTCQICGKYMPDGVGLHIDHIVPIAKGGKTVESNLQVLCSKCNGRKSNK